MLSNFHVILIVLRTFSLLFIGKMLTYGFTVSPLNIHHDLLYPFQPHHRYYRATNDASQSADELNSSLSSLMERSQLDTISWLVVVFSSTEEEELDADAKSFIQVSSSLNWFLTTVRDFTCSSSRLDEVYVHFLLITGVRDDSLAIYSLKCGSKWSLIRDK